MKTRQRKPTKKWDDVSDTITVEDLMQITGVGETNAKKIFNSKGFPLIDYAGLKADKEAARMFLQGFKIRDNTKNSLEYMILLELRKINQKIEEMEDKRNEEIQI